MFPEKSTQLTKSNFVKNNIMYLSSVHINNSNKLEDTSTYIRRSFTVKLKPRFN